MARRPRPAVSRVPEVAQLRLGRGRGRVDDLRSERRGAVLGVGVRLGAPQAVVHVDGADAVPERPESVPEAGRVGAARHEARDLAAPRDELPGPDVRLDALEHVHGRSVPNGGEIALVARPPGRIGQPGRSSKRGALAHATRVSAARSTASASSAWGAACGTCAIRAAGSGRPRRRGRSGSGARGRRPARRPRAGRGARRARPAIRSAASTLLSPPPGHGASGACVQAHAR